MHCRSLAPPPLPRSRLAPALLLATLATESGPTASRCGPYSLCHALYEPAYRCRRCRSWVLPATSQLLVLTHQRSYRTACCYCTFVLLHSPSPVERSPVSTLSLWSPWSPYTKSLLLSTLSFKRSRVANPSDHPPACVYKTTPHARYTLGAACGLAPMRALEQCAAKSLVCVWACSCAHHAPIGLSSMARATALIVQTRTDDPTRRGSPPKKGAGRRGGRANAVLEIQLQAATTRARARGGGHGPRHSGDNRQQRRECNTLLDVTCES